MLIKNNQSVIEYCDSDFIHLLNAFTFADVKNLFSGRKTFI